MKNLIFDKKYTHDELKEIAKEFLESIGCEKIEFEKEILNGKFIHDVIGFKNKKMCVVECGTLDPIRLATFQGLYGDNFFWFPYYSTNKKTNSNLLIPHKDYLIYRNDLENLKNKEEKFKIEKENFDKKVEFQNAIDELYLLFINDDGYYKRRFIGINNLGESNSETIESLAKIMLVLMDKKGLNIFIRRLQEKDEAFNIKKEMPMDAY